tara:strand:+ start:373 stop:696 length:324 start_codon:yes stop_codon:yes gene_type:complete
MAKEKVKEEVENSKVDSTKEKGEATEKTTPQNVLLGTISYKNEEDYEKFLNNLDINQSLFVLISACGYAQSRGAYGLEESELISRAIKTIKKTSEASKPASAEEDKK